MSPQLCDGFPGRLDALCSFEREGDWPLRVLDRVLCGADTGFAGGIGFGSFQGVFGIADLVLQLANVRPAGSTIEGHAYGHPFSETLNDGPQRPRQRGQAKLA